MKFLLVFTAAVGFLTGNVLGQDHKEEGYKVDFKVAGLENQEVLLAFYYNENTYTKDTVKATTDGRFSFIGKEKLPAGVYIIVKFEDKTKLFDFVVYDDQYFQLETKADDPYREMKVIGDINNELFIKNLLFNASQNVKADPLNLILKSETSSVEEKTRARENLVGLNKEVVAFQNDIIEKHPKTLVAKIISARMDVDVPLINKEEGIDSTYQYYYFKNHFWDGVDLSDESLLRLPFPLITSKIDQFFDKLLIQDADTIIKEINKVIAKTSGNQEMYKFVTWSLTTKYYAPQIMGLDKVFVFLSDEYFSSGKMDFWADAQLKKNIVDRAAQLRLSMLGMKGPNLVMQDDKLIAKSMYDIQNKYTILYFYDPDCGHCKKETPVLVNFTKNTQFDVKVYSVCADSSMVKMKGYINEMGMEKFINVNGPRSYVGNYQDLYDAFQTPTVYVLDDKKKIIAKKLPAERLEDFLLRYEKVEGKK